MLRIDISAQQALNIEHTIRPQAGDYWHEMFAPCFLVVWTDGWHIEFLDHQTHYKRVGNDHWTWDTSKPAVRATVEEFQARVRYSSPDMDDKTWCWVVPAAKHHAWAVAEAAARR